MDGSKRTLTHWLVFAGMVLSLAAIVSGCGRPKSGQPRTASVIALNGAGSTFAQPFYSAWIDSYKKNHPNVRLNYQGIGSGAGIQQLQAQTLDWGGTDAPVTAAQQKAAKGGTILNLPMAIGPVVISYNLKGVGSGLKLSQKALADIYLGKVKSWNDPEITSANPNVKLPNQPIVVAHRSDASGTSYIFTDFLSHVSLDWKTKVGTSKSPAWPVGLGGKGNPGVSAIISQTSGAIGYVEYAYAVQSKLPVAAIQNKAGKFVLPSTQSASLAAAGVSMPSDFVVSIVNPQGDKAYPISSFTWLMLYKKQRDPAKGKALVDFVKWGLTDGQKLLPRLDYVPIPQNVIKMELAALQSVSS